MQFCEAVGPIVLNLENGQDMTAQCKDVLNSYPLEHFVSDCREFYGECYTEVNDCYTCKANVFLNTKKVIACTNFSQCTASKES